ncbi:MAG: PHP domain-containing protein, partial [Salinarimonas sp.]
MSVLREVGFVHLHVHSSYSLLEGALPIAKLAKLAEADRQPALALTDTNNLFGALEFSEKLSGAGIQPIPGVQITTAFEAADPTQRHSAPGIADLVLLATCEEGYVNLMRLVSRGYFDVDLGAEPCITIEALAEHAQGVIALTGGLRGPLDRVLVHGRSELAEQRFARLRDIFGDRLYVEIQRHGMEEERAVEGALIAMADRHGVGLVASNEPF